VLNCIKTTKTKNNSWTKTALLDNILQKSFVYAFSRGIGPQAPWNRWIVCTTHKHPRIYGDDRSRVDIREQHCGPRIAGYTRWRRR